MGKTYTVWYLVNGGPEYRKAYGASAGDVEYLQREGRLIKFLAH